MNFSQSPVIGTIKVLYNFSEEFVTPKKIKSVEELLDIAAKKHLPRNTKSLVLHKLHHFYGEVVYVSMVQYCIINGLDYDEFSRQAWRYSSLEHTDLHHVWIGGLKAENV
ncbi:putative Female sterile M3 [Daphnia magna]|uniref:Putative Female sterile M3 n=1 Tax=Daphnia magna TaxID=35525 RepID=A0A164IW85_9CRUS|nr:putative Female sterile M3 [Daphnia magna]